MEDGSRLARLVEEGDRFLELANAALQLDRSPSLGAPLLRRALRALAEIQALAHSPDLRGKELPDLAAALSAETLLDGLASSGGETDEQTTRRYERAVVDVGRALGALREKLGLPEAVGRGEARDAGAGASVTWRFVVAAFLAPFVLVSLWWVLFRSSEAPKQIEFSPNPPANPAPAPATPPAAPSPAPAASLPSAGGEAAGTPVPEERISSIGVPVDTPVRLASAADGVFHRFLVSSGPSGRYDVRLSVSGTRCASRPSEDAFASLVVRIDGQQIAVVTPRSETPEETAIKGVSLGVGSRLDLVMSGDFAISGQCDRNLSVELRSISASRVTAP